MKAQISKYQRSSDTVQGKTNTKLREELILTYAPLVRSIADRMAIRLPPHISSEELTSAGIVGLLDALDKFDAELGIKFKTYAEHRIKGAMLDELRKMDWVPRSVRKDIHRMEDAILAVQAKLRREPEDFEVAQELGIDLDTYYRMISRAQGVGLLSLDALLPDGLTSIFAKQPSDDPSPLDETKKKELKKIVAKALASLSEKEQLVISLYYYDELTLKEIAKVLDLTESRISQIHSKAIIRLRAKLKSYYKS
jgi:RNA polymerase sigma factor for flagellar operon FliA